MAPLNRDIRRLISSKSDKIIFGDGLPVKSQGKNGDISIRNIKGRGTHLFIKATNKWFNIPMHLGFISRDDIDRIVSGQLPKYVGEIGRTSNTFSFKTNSDVTIQSHGDNDLTLQTGDENATGTIKINNGADGDIELHPNANGYVNIHDGVLKVYSNLSKHSSSSSTPVLVSDSGVLKYRTAAEIVVDGGGGTNFLTNDAADIMAVSDFGAVAALKIDADQPATTSAEDSKGFWIDYDRIVAGSGTAAHNDIGIDLDVNTDSRGTSSAVGMDIDVVAGTTGTNTATGIDISVSGSSNHQGLNITVPDGANDYHVKLMAGDDVNDYATFLVADTGDLTIATVGSGTTDSNLILDIDGDIELNAAGSDINFKDANKQLATISYDDSGVAPVSKLRLYNSPDVADYFTIAVTAEGATTISTNDDGTAVAHLTISPDGDLKIKSDIKIDNTKKLYLDGGTGTYIQANADRLILAAGNDTMVTFFELGTSGNYANFGSTVIGFPRVDHSSSFDATNTPIDFRLGQKTRLELTGDITNVNLRFPNISGNFILVCSANGDHDVTNWKALKHDGSAATTGDVMWPGGTKPAFTDGSSSDSTDVVSFYWDNTEEQCYGVASLAFATP